MLLPSQPNEKLPISDVTFNLHGVSKTPLRDFWSSGSTVRNWHVLLAWEEMTSHSTVFCATGVWVSVPLPQFLQIVCRFITSICSFFCQINETKVQNKIYFDKTFKCWFVYEWKSWAFANVLMVSSITTETPPPKSKLETADMIKRRVSAPVQFGTFASWELDKSKSWLLW